jgi:hypothetical protein
MTQSKSEHAPVSSAPDDWSCSPHGEVLHNLEETDPPDCDECDWLCSGQGEPIESPPSTIPNVHGERHGFD